jgi:uncharacterized protein
MNEKMQFLYQLKLIPRLLEEKNWTEEDNVIVAEHFDRLQMLTEKKIVILAGRTLNMDEEGFGIVIFEANNHSEAISFMNEDPAIAKGIMTGKLFPYKVALMQNR